MSEDSNAADTAVAVAEPETKSSLEGRVAALEADLKAAREEILVMRSSIAFLVHRLEQSDGGALGSASPSTASTSKTKKPNYGTLPKALPSTRPATAAPASSSPAPKEKESESPTPSSTTPPPVNRSGTVVRPTPSPAKTDTTPIKRYGTLPRGTKLTQKDDEDEKKPKTPASVSKVITARTPDPKEDEDSSIDPARRGFYNLGARKVYYILPENQAKEEKATAPSTDLALDFVYGYNGKATRANLFFGKNPAEVVYSIAGTAVAYNLSTHKQRFMTHHSEDIMSLAVHPNREIAATGQLDPKGVATPYILIWNVETMEVIRKITYHDHGISCLAFSADGKYLASVGDDDSHTVAIWDWENAGVKGLGADKIPKHKKDNDLATPLIEQMVSKDEVYAIAFNPTPGTGASTDGGEDAKAESHGPIDLEFVTLGVKHIKIWTVHGLASPEKKNRKLVSRIPSTFSKTKIVQKGFNSVAFTGTGEYLVATESGHVYRFKGSELLKFYPAHGENSVGVIAKLEQGFATSGDDGKLKFWDADFKESTEVDLAKGAKTFEARSIDFAHGKLLVGTKANSIIEVDISSKETKILMEGHRNEVWALDVHPTEPIIVTGAHDKYLRLWNYVDRTVVEGKTFNLNDKVRSAIFTPDGKHLAVGTWGGKMFLYAYPSLEQLWEKKVSLGETIDALAVSPDSSILAAGSWDQIIYVIAIPSGKILHTLKGHTSSVLMVNFSVDGKCLQSNSKDYEILYWDVVKGKRLNKAAEYADLQWFGWNCFLGWPVQGIWEDTGDGTDINAVDRSESSALLATGDDFGRVRLYSYPVMVKDAPSKTYNGHSSHVTSVRFSPGDQYLFSAGGADTGVFQWRLTQQSS